MWVVVVVINGLTMFSAQSFGSEEACHLAAKTAQMGRCVELQQQDK
jgi:hypothetical protein